MTPPAGPPSRRPEAATLADAPAEAAPRPGVALRGQTASLEHGAHVVVGTPGRVLDLPAKASAEAQH